MVFSLYGKILARNEKVYIKTHTHFAKLEPTEGGYRKGEKEKSGSKGELRRKG